jgi:hypothetical protein
MGVRLLAAAILCAGFAVPAIAGQGSSADGAEVSVTPGVELNRLPINVARIGKQLRQTQVREERNGLRLRYDIQVYGEAPRFKLVTPLDNLLLGNVPNTAPTHNDMIRQMTPKEFSTPVFSISTPSRK